jgi:phage-related minor tail protein
VAKPVRLTLFVDNDQLKRAFDESANKVDRFGRDIEQHSSKVGTAAVAMGAFVAGAALSIVDKLGEVAVAAVTFLPKLGEEFDNVTDKMIIASANNPIMNGEMKASFDRLLPQLASPMEDIGDVVSTLAQRLGITGPLLDDVSAQILDITRITGGDLAANTQGVAQAFDLWNVSAEEMPGLIDFLSAASMQSGAAIGDLVSQIDDSSLSLKTLGFDLRDVITAAARLDRASLSIDDVNRGLNKLIAENPGKELSTVFDDFVSGIQNGTISLETTLDVIGNKGGNTFFRLAQDGKLNFGSLRADIDATRFSVNDAKTATEDWPEKWTIAQNGIKAALEPIANDVFSNMNRVLGVLIGKDASGAPNGTLNVAGAWDEIVKIWNEAWPKIEPVLADIWKKFTDWWNSEDTQQGIKNIGASLAGALGDGFKEGLSEAFSADSFADYARNKQESGIGAWIMDKLGMGEGFDPGGAFAPQGGRAMGGPVMAGMPYTVGEHRREMFVPKVDGVIVAGDKMSQAGGGDTFNIVAPSPVATGMELIRIRRKQAYLAGVS